MFALFDLSGKDIIHLALFDEQCIVHKEVEGRNRELLAVLADFLDEQKVDNDTVEGIMTVVGTGSFTSTRLGTTVANTFAFVRKIPLLTITADQIDQVQTLIPELLKRPPGQYVSATYSAEANIGKKK